MGDLGQREGTVFRASVWLDYRYSIAGWDREPGKRLVRWDWIGTKEDCANRLAAARRAHNVVKWELVEVLSHSGEEDEN